jgi:hypothetical protein
MQNSNRKSSKEPVKIGSVLQDFMQNVVDEKATEFQTISSLWKKIVPENLLPHCDIVEIENGVIKVGADSPSVVFELRLEGNSILLQIQKSCPAMRIKKLKFVVGRG